ncbi:MAG: VTT domain-containing protein [Deltaproteobacteria bacterium]
MEDILAFVQSSPGGWGLFAVFAAAALEYLMPPLPADTVVLAGSLFVVAGVHSFLLVDTVAIAGGALGAAVHFGIGHKFAKPDGSVRGGRYVEMLVGEGRLEKFFEVFRKRGMWVIAVNRALPGIRAVTFFAAGAARLPFTRTMAFGLISNVVWSTAILSLGVALGGNWEKIDAAFGVYKTVVYGVFGTALALYVAYRLYQRTRRKPPQEPQA